MLISLTYASRARDLTGTDVKHILEASRRNNAAAGITGALCYSSGIFLQCLEGDRSLVNKLYHRILNDPRHTDPTILDMQEIVARQFTQWSMGLISNTAEHAPLFLKYALGSSFNPYDMSAASLRAFFTEVQAHARWLC